MIFVTNFLLRQYKFVKMDGSYFVPTNAYIDFFNGIFETSNYEDDYVSLLLLLIYFKSI